MHELLDYLLTAAPAAQPMAGVEAWWATHQERTARFARPVERAMVGGFLADRPGYAFASGYHEALVHLVGRDTATRRALCATEAGGNQPRDIQTELARDTAGAWRLNGHKQWVTLATHVDELLIVASLGQTALDAVPDAVPAASPRKHLVVVSVPAARSGVSLEPMPATPFIPEIPHARVHLQDVLVADHDILPGDGYARYLKPFRTVEDIHVHAALLAWLVQTGRRVAWPDQLIEQLVAVLTGLHALAGADPSSRGVHVALAGLIARSQVLEGELDPYCSALDQAGTEHWARWRRDRQLLAVAGKARAQRREVAWQRLRTG